MLKSFQTLVLNDIFTNKSYKLLKWSPYDPTRLAVLIKTGIYVLKIDPVPTNLSPTLNTCPIFYEDEYVGFEWLTDCLLLLLTSKGNAVIKDTNDEYHEPFEFSPKLKIQALGFLPGYLITATEKKLIAWEVKDKAFSELTSIEVSDSIGEVLPLEFGGGFLIIFVTCGNGQALMYKMDKETQTLSKIPDALWSEEDHIPARNLSAMAKDLVESRSCKILFSKGNYVVLSQLDLSHPNLETVQVSPKQWVQIGAHNITDIKEFNDTEWLVAHEHGPFNLLQIPSNLENPCEVSCFVSDLDMNNCSCHGLERSKNGYIWACLQEGPFHQDMSKSKCKVVFMSALDCRALASDFSNLPEPSVEFGDLLEAFRIQLLQQPQALAETSTLEMMTRMSPSPLKYWLSLLLFGADSVNREKWSKVVSDTAKEVLVCHAKKRLTASNIKYKASLSHFIADNSASKAKNTKKYEWICRTCKGKPSDQSLYFDVLVCENGHSWPRCCVSLQVCDSANLAQCSWCRAIALPEFANEPCTLCCCRLTTCM